MVQVECVHLLRQNRIDQSSWPTVLGLAVLFGWLWLIGDADLLIEKNTADWLTAEQSELQTCSPATLSVDMKVKVFG